MIDLPVHQYVTISPGVVHDDVQHGVWFAVQSNIGAIWGGHVMLENGAIYRNVPLHLLSIGRNDSPYHSPHDLQLWDCYHEEARAHEYNYLRGLYTISQSPKASAPFFGSYLFTIIPKADSFSRHLDQAKEFVVSVVAGTGRIVIRATNELMFCDKSIAPLPTVWPKGLRRQMSMPSVEGLEAHKMATEAIKWGV